MAKRCDHWSSASALEFFSLSASCGAWICDSCSHHAHVNQSTGKVIQDLARCWCGWERLGGNGYRELLELGETIESD